MKPPGPPAPARRPGSRTRSRTPSARARPRSARTSLRTTRVIGIDPGTNAVGYAVLDRDGSQVRLAEAGVIRAPKGEPIEVRLTAIFDALVEKIGRAKADAAAIEQVVYGKSIRSALRTGEGRGVAILAAGAAGLPVAEYSPTKVKKAATGSGSAGKAQVQEMVRRLLGLEQPPPQDAADAVAIALCHCLESRRSIDEAVAGSGPAAEHPSRRPAARPPVDEAGP